MIVTSNDVGLEVKCNYNLSNKSVSHNADLEVDGQLPGEANAEQTIVQAPNVTMRITDRYNFKPLFNSLYFCPLPISLSDVNINSLFFGNKKPFLLESFKKASCRPERIIFRQRCIYVIFTINNNIVNG